MGIALDPTANKMYWTSFVIDNPIRVATLDGSGTASALLTGENQPVFTALLRTPVGTGAPSITNGPSAAAVGSSLGICSRSAWFRRSGGTTEPAT